MITLKQHNIKPYGELCMTLEKYNKCAYISATGTGKSYITAKYVEDFHKQEDCIVIVPTTVIGDNWKKLLPDINTITYQGSCVNDEIEHELMNKSLIVLDEFHHVGAEKWGKPFFDILDKFEGKIIGLSATPVRYLDNCRNMVDEFFDGVCVNGLTLPEAIESGVLPSFQYITALYNLPDVIESTRLSVGKSKTLSDSTETLFQQLDIMASKYSFNNILMKYLKDKGYFKIIVFVDTIDALDDIGELMDGLDLDFHHYVVNSIQKKRDNDFNLNRFKEDKQSSFLFCVDMINEGIHVDGTTGIIMFRKTQSPAVYLQQIGRALSSSEYVHIPLIFDFVANHSNLKTYKSVQENSIHYINSQINDPCKQIIVSDYAMEEEELMQKISDILNSKWSDEEIQILRDNYNSMSTKELQKLLPGRSIDNINYRLRIEGLSNKKRVIWTEDEIQILRDNYNNIQCKELQKLLPGRSLSSIRNAAIKFGVTDTHNIFSNEFKEDVRKHYPNENGIEFLMEKYPHISKRSIVVFARNNKISKRNLSKWTDDEILILKNNINMPIKELQQLVPNHPETSIYLKINFLCKKYNIQKSRINKWDDDKINRFRELYQVGGTSMVKDNEEFADLTSREITQYAYKYKIRRDMHYWTDEEVYILRDNCGKLSLKEIQKLLPERTLKAIRTKLRLEGLSSKIKKN